MSRYQLPHSGCDHLCPALCDGGGRYPDEIPEPTLDELIFDEEYGKWADRVDRDRRVLVDPDDMWIDPRITEQVAA